MNKFLPFKQLVAFLITTFIIFFSNSGFAEVIVFKSGKSIDVNIIHQDLELIQVDIDGILITYHIADLESIDGQMLLSSAQQNPVLGPKHYSTYNPGSGLWEKWFNQSGARDYIFETQAVDLLFKKHFYLVSGLIEDFDAAQKDDRSNGLLTKMKSESQALSFKLKSVFVPEEFIKYNNMLIKICEVDQLAVDSLLGYDPESANAYQRQLTLLVIATMKELKSIYILRKAPEGIIFDIDAVISVYSEALNVS